MTLAELQDETLSQKYRRLQQEKCEHEEVYSSTVWTPVQSVTVTNSLCLDCFKSWRTPQSKKARSFRHGPRSNP